MIYLYYALAAVGIALVTLLVVAALRPTNFHIARSQQIQKTPEELFPYFHSLRKFQEWNPYREKDPQARSEFEGPEAGPGAVFHWIGDGNVGEGYMRIVESISPQKVLIDLEFIKPFSARNEVEFSLVPERTGALVTWSMRGKYAFFPKLMGLFMNMDRMIGNDFEHGLRRLKSLAETGQV